MCTTSDSFPLYSPISLARTVQRLGRADSVKEFVRKGADKALIELLISGGPDKEDFRIERELHAEHAASKFRINGAVTLLPARGLLLIIPCANAYSVVF